MFGLINGRYTLYEVLGQGSMGIVYRAVDRLTGETVALKQVTIPPEQLALSSQPQSPMGSNLRLALAQEFQILAGLRHPHIVSVLDYGFDEEGLPFFTMDYLPAGYTLLSAAEHQPVARKLQLLQQLLQAIAYLHRRNILHRDLKPHNILVSRSEVRVLDFGLAANEKSKGEYSVGTPQYLPPEVWNDQPYSYAADLYAVGVIAYELFAGEHPFAPINYSFVERVLNDEPALDRLGVNDAAATVIGRLLAKKPEDRYESAETVLAALAQAFNHPLPEETRAIRDSYLQTAAFVGRDDEMASLQQALEQCKAGQGSLWLVGGESGVGKSRLLNELRVQALVNGVTVLQGQASGEQNKSSFQLWLPILCNLLLLADVNDQTASILKALIPDVEALLDRPVAAAPVLAGEAGQQRLLAAITTLFQQQTKPILLILEDLQWAHEALFVLRHIQPLLATSALMVVGSYRADEAPHLPEQVPDSHLLLLERLSETAVSQFTYSMLGEMGQRPEIIAFLQRETEGNAFFLVETVRALAEEAGRLNTIGDQPLPEHLFPSGVWAIVQQRLGQMDKGARPLLKMAAIIGRQIDEALLNHLFPSRNLKAWILACGEKAILDIHQGQWRFAHDKLREGVLIDVPHSQQQRLHEQVAQAMEVVYAGHNHHASVLAHHWQKAGNLTKAIDYLHQAGDVAARVYANLEAITYYTQAITFSEQIIQTEPSPEMITDLISLYTRLGRTLQLNAQVDKALALYEQMEVLAKQLQNQPMELVALVNHGQIRCTGTPYFNRELGETLSHTALLLAQALGDVAAEAKVLWNLLNLYRYTDRLPEARVCGEQALALSQLPEDSELKAFILNDLSHVYRSLGVTDASQSCLAQAITLWRQLNNLAMLADSLSTACFVSAYAGNFTQSIAFADEAYGISLSIHNVWGQSYSRWYVGNAYWELGQPSQALKLMDEGIRWGEESGFGFAQVSVRADQALVYGGLGALDKGLAVAQTAVSRAEEVALHARPYALASLARLHLLNGDMVKAETAVAQIDSLKTLDILWPPLVPFVACQLAFAQGDFKQVISLTEERLRGLNQYGLPAFVPETLLLRGQAFLSLNLDKAGIESLQLAQKAAEQNNSRRLLWQILALLAEVATDWEQQMNLQQQAYGLINFIKGHIHQQALQNSFREVIAAKTSMTLYDD